MNSAPLGKPRRDFLNRAIGCLALASAALLPLPGSCAEKVMAVLGGSERVVYDKSSALIIGVSVQDDPAWNSLTTVSGQMDRLGEALKAQGFDVERLDNPTGDQLFLKIRSFLAEHGGKLERVLIYFSGHGHSDKELTGYIVPRDAPDPRTEFGKFRSKALSMTQIMALAVDAQNLHTLFVFDSCFSGMVFQTKSNIELSPMEFNELSRKSRQFITAGNEKQKVPNDGQFLAAFIDGINGKADLMKDGVITGTELGLWLTRALAPAGQQTPQIGKVKEYTLSVGEFMFLPKASVVKVIAPPTDLDTSNVNKKSLSNIVVGVKKGDETEVKAETEVKVREVAASSKALPKVPSEFSGLTIKYFKKFADGDTLQNAFDEAKVPYEVTRAIRPGSFKTNALACHPDIPVDALKKIAFLMMDNGYPLQAIVPFRRPADKQNRIEILTQTDVYEDGTEVASANLPLTANDIERLTGCVDLQFVAD